MNTRTDCSPRIIKRISSKQNTDDASKYEFYRHINHLSIIRLDNEADKLNYSSWLTRLDNETSDLKMHLIKILFISLRSDKSFQIFLKPPPDDLNDLELMSDNTMDMVKWLQDNNIPDESSTTENKQDIKHRRSAAVATNMRSYTTIKTSPYFVQSFYVRSDWPIYTWYNPTSIGLPSNHDHNQWELYLNRFQIVTDDKSAIIKHRNECDDIIPIDQVSKEVADSFNWHPYSILINEETRPKRTAGSIAIDTDVGNQICNQQQIDDAAFAIVSCKVFPGNKVLSKRMYSDTLIPDKKFIFKMTGVTIVDYSGLKLKNDETLPFICKLKERKRAVKNRCGVKEKTPCPCEKPMMVMDCRKPKSPCSTTVPQNTNQINQTKPSNTISIINQSTCNIKTEMESDSKFSNLNMTYQECKSSSKCLKRSVKKTKSVESCKFPKEADLDVDDNNESQDHTNCPKVFNAGRSSFNESLNCDWTVSSVEISMTEPDRACNSTPEVAKAPNCTLIPPDQVAHVEPENQSTRNCSSVQNTTPPAAPKTPNCNTNICTLIPADKVENVEPEDQSARNCSSVQKTTPAAEKAPNCSADICASFLSNPVERVEPVNQSARNCSSVQKTAPAAAKTPNCNTNICASIVSDQVERVEPEDQRARNCSSVQKTAPAAKPQRQCPRTTECVREPPPQEQCRQRSLGIRDGTRSEPTENGNCSGGCRRTSAPEPRDRCANARGPTSDDGRKVGQCPGQDQNRSCPSAFAEHRPKTPTDNGRRADAIFSGDRQRASPGQRMSAPQPRDRCAASARGPTSDDGRRVGQCPGKDQNRSCQAAFSEYRTKTPREPDNSAVSCSDRRASQQQQQQQQYDHEGSRSNDRSNTAAPDDSWNPEVSSYAAFSNSHVTEDRFHFLTSERMVDDRSAATRLMPANDFHSAAAAAAANDDNYLSDESNWSAEQGCQSCAQPINRFNDDHNNNNNNYYSSSSLSTLTSSDSSIDMRMAARHPIGRNVNCDRRTDRLMSTNSSGRYPFNSSLSPNLSNVALRRATFVVADEWPPAHDLVEDVSMPGSLVTGPWSLSMSDSRTDRYRDSSDVGAADQYNNNFCSGGGNATGQDDYGGSETDDDEAGVASGSRRDY
ncbi:unnamed protein product [Macrosiphum euphorbiae]|uniref:Uncharacterized protein n=1 Tax=Macrosiphum euphorbiae TaxID=13131 RepID=A0AAV0VN68_9HEMI|nr:unnamed protein product [Macrosiphum euphorbiae]